MIKLAKLNNQPEIFHSIQGEGKNLGRPSVFVRLSLCNLYCIWCDTDYTWNWEGTRFPHRNDALEGYTKFKKADYIIQLPNTEIIRCITQYNCPNLVITGGEPLVQKKDLLPLVKALKALDPAYHIEFETNGTILPGKELDGYSDQYNVSVKLSNSRVDYADRIIPDAISFFARSPKANFKFVVDEASDLAEIIALQEAFDIASDKIYLMPQGTKVSALQSKEMWLVDSCKAHNFNYTDRIHIRIFGDKRGV